MAEMTYLEIANLNENARIAAIREITDQEMLAKFAEEDTNDGVRNAAVSQITDLEILTDIATDKKSTDMLKEKWLSKN
jgi:hypothetical protein